MKAPQPRINSVPCDRYRVADLHVDLASRSVMRGDETLNVTDLTFDMLAFLIQQAPEEVSRETFAEHVWKVSHLTEETLAKRAAMLRRALGDSARSPTYVRTVRGVGYALSCTAEPIEPHLTATLPTRAKTFAAIAASIVAVASATFFLLPQTGTSSPTDRVMETSLAALQLTRAKDLLALHQPLETDHAISLLEAALSSEPSSYDLKLALSFAYSTRATKFTQNAADIQKAETLARDLIAQDLTLGGAWHALGYALDAQGRVDEAIPAYQQAFTLNPEDAAAMSSAAYLYQIRGRYSDALDLEARALNLGESTLYAPIQVAVTLSYLDHPASPLWWERALAIGSHQSVILAEAMLEDLRRGAPQLALDRFALAPDALKHTPRMLRISGRAHLALGQIGAARDAFEQAGEEAAFDRAALAQQTGAPLNTASVVEMAQTAMLEGDSWPELRVRLAEVYAASGDNDAALALLSRAVDLGWRDYRFIQTSPFLTSLTKTDEWATIEHRIKREISAQRELVLANQSSPTSAMINAPL